MTDKPAPTEHATPTALPAGWKGGAPDSEAFFILAEEALTTLPEPIKALSHDLVIVVEDMADGDLLREMEIENGYELTGLYEGIPLTERSIDHSAAMPDRVILYRLPILMEWIESGERLDWLIRHIVIHEVGHHFGFSDEDMHALEEQAKA